MRGVARAPFAGSGAFAGRGPGVCGYNRLVKSLVVAIVVGCIALSLAGCNRGAEQSAEAVRAAILDYLAKRGSINVASMQVDVVSVSFRENEADATVSFRPKGSDASGAGMTMQYTLEKQGGRWAVKGRPEGAAGHAGQGAAPEGMPSGHPPVAGATSPESKK
jgi:hypothetical protein